MRIDVWSDISCPFCRIGLTNLAAALKDFEHAGEVTVALHAFLLQSDLEGPVTDRPYAQWLAVHKSVAPSDVEEMFANISGIGEGIGLGFDWDSVVAAPTGDAHRLVYLAHDVDADNGTATGADPLALRVHLALHRAYFEEGRDISDRSVLTEIGVECGIPADRVEDLYAAGRHDEVVTADFATGMQMGLQGVPAFVFDGKYLVQGAQPAEVMAQALQTSWEGPEEQ
ncbi:DsbA family oxidoreductase [Corynebacterium sp. 335C]